MSLRQTWRLQPARGAVSRSAPLHLPRATRFARSELPPSAAHVVLPLTALYVRTLTQSAVRWQPASSSSSSTNAVSVSSGEKEKGVSASSSTSTSSGSVSSSSKKPEKSRWERIKEKVKAEATHYWHGTKLLGKEVRISTRITGRLLRGYKLTRRERRQLKRTTSDLLRLIPFSVFLIVPFMELLLPVALKLFPNMLPSTFTDKFQEDEKKRKLLKVRLEMAKFLQETIKESGIKSPEKIKESEEFKEFFRKVRSTGESPTTEEVVKVSRLFENDLTLDNLSRPQLVSMCRYMNINAFGTDNFLRYTIRNRLQQLKEDDRVIDGEGLDALTLHELQAACQSRGIRTLGVDEEHLKQELDQWIDLHIRRGLSGTLLILSKAFSFNRHAIENRKTPQGEGDHIMASLKDTLASLPDTLVNAADLEISSDSASYKQRLEVLQQQEELIEDEEEQEERERQERLRKKEAEEEKQRQVEEQEKAAKEAVQAGQMLPEEEAKVQEEEEKTKPEDVRMTKEQVTELGQALEILSAKSSVIKEREELRKLIQENAEATADAEGQSNPLAKRVKSMLSKIEKQLEEYDQSVGDKLNMFNTDHEGKISLADLKSALQIIRHRPSDEAIEILIQKLDVDHDYFVPLADLLSLAEGEGLGIVLSEDVPSAHVSANTLAKDRQKFADGFSSGRQDRPSSPSSSSSSGPSSKKKEDEPKLKKEDVVES